MVIRICLLVAGFLCALSTSVLAQETAHGDAVRPRQQDQQHYNNLQRGVDSNGREADVRQLPRQGGESDDLNITQRIRRAILEDDSLSIYAQNVKIITQHGVVTLRGSVRSTAEKDSVEQKARTVVGAANVRNEIQVGTANGMRY